jgi:predicted phosphatase
MKNYLYSVSSEVWQVGCDGVDFLNDAEQPTLDQLQKIHCNAQAISIPTSLIDKEEFNHVDGLNVAKDIWDTLRMAHKGSRPVRKANIEMLEGQLNRFIMFDDESPQDMFNQLKKMVNKTKALGSKNWNYRMSTKRLMRVYTPMNYNVVVLIHQHPTYKKMTSDDVLRRIKNHEMCIQEVNHIKNLYVGVTTTKKREIAFNATKKSKNKQVVVESSCEEEEEDSSECYAEEMALFMRKFKKYMSKKKFSKGDKKFNTKSTTKRIWYNCGKHGHLIANCPFERREEDDDKKKSKFYKKDKSYKRSDKPYKKKSYGEAHIGKE